MNADSNVSHRGKDLVDDVSYLLRGRDLKDLLSEVVAKLVSHHILEVRQQSHHQGLLEVLFDTVLVQLLLKHPAPCLVVTVETCLVYHFLVFSRESIIGTEQVAGQAGHLSRVLYDIDGH